MWTLGQNLEEVIQVPQGYREKINDIVKYRQGVPQKKPWQANLISSFPQGFQVDGLERPQTRYILVLAFFDNLEKGQMNVGDMTAWSCEFTDGSSTLKITD